MIRSPGDTFQEISKQKKLISDDAKKLLGARFGPVSKNCDNCNKKLESLCVVVMKPQYPKVFSTLYILCHNCRLLHSPHVKHYLYIDR